MIVEVTIISLALLICVLRICKVIENVFCSIEYVQVADQAEDTVVGGFARESQEMPDELPEQDSIDEKEGSERLQRINAEFDARINELRDELDDRPPGHVYNINHELVDSKYIPIPVEEYAK